MIKFYSRYVDDTLVLIKDENINAVHNALNRFHKNIKFTVDKFTNETPHFLDIEIAPDGLTIYHKETQTGQYMHFKSNTPWLHKTAWISALVYRAKSICSTTKFSFELKRIRQYISWNGFPKRIADKIINKTCENHQRKSSQQQDTGKEEGDKNLVFFHLPYTGIKGEQLVKSCLRKIRKCLKKDSSIRFKVLYETCKISYFTNTKDKTEKLQQSNVVYEFRCPGCGSKYIGKTERSLAERINEHAWSTKNGPVFLHLKECTEFDYIINLHKINNDEVDIRSLHKSYVANNTNIIDKGKNWEILIIKEGLCIKNRNPELNNGFQYSYQPKLF